MSQTALYSQMVHVVGGSGSAPGLSSICNSARWPEEGALLPAAGQALFQVPLLVPPLRLLPSPCGCRLKLGLGS